MQVFTTVVVAAATLFLSVLWGFYIGTTVSDPLIRNVVSFSGGAVIGLICARILFEIWD